MPVNTAVADRLTMRLMQLWDRIPADEQALLAECAGADDVTGFARHEVTREEWEQIVARMIKDANRIGSLR